jgi:starch phosphorylase
VRAIRRFTVRTRLPEAIEDLDRLAQNLYWTWTPTIQDLFASIDPKLWESVKRDPVALLGALGPQDFDRLASDAEFVARVHQASQDLTQYLTEPRWYQEQGDAMPKAIAYFSPEFGITSVLPQYSGGLGILAGDHLKSASDLGVPIVGVGLLYGAGYFKQSLSRDGWQLESYPVIDPDDLPLVLLREEDGSAAEIVINMPHNRKLHAHIWKAMVGRVPLLLLDSNVPKNDDVVRGVTDRLYGGGEEHRLAQEILLGVGGVRALRIWSRLTGAPAPEVFHTNEGHAGFLGIERIGELTAQGLSATEALEAVQGSTVFTTHTPVPAGIDRFPKELIVSHFGGACERLGVPVDGVLALGSEDYPGGNPTVFNMAVMGLRLAGMANGVSQLHGEVSRQMFQGLWPGFDVNEVPIGSVTNGVHEPTWVNRRLLELATERFTPAEKASGAGWLRAGAITDAELWDVLGELRAHLVADVRERLRQSWRERGLSPAELGWVDEVLDPNVLTIGFARRVPTYKRLTLMLRDPERLKALLLDPERPIQLVIAGKAHPDDDQGKRLIQKMVKWADDPEVRHRIVYLPNYDIEMAQALYPGCDVWLNNPLRPLEACGTSGMKAALNGALNLSILDGWWNEWYDGANGWEIPTADGVDNVDRRDDLEAAALYELLECHVRARFYDRDKSGLPSRWLEMVRHTLATLGPKVQATRMVADYVKQYYVPAAEQGRALDANGHAGAKDLAAWKRKVETRWQGVGIDHVESVDVGDVAHLGDKLQIRAYVSLDGLGPSDVKVEVVYGRVTQSDELKTVNCAELQYLEPTDAGRYAFGGEIDLQQSGEFGYTVRIKPKHPLLSSDAEMGLVVNAQPTSA